MARLAIPYERETRFTRLEKDEIKLATLEGESLRSICEREINNVTQKYEVRSPNEDWFLRTSRNSNKTIKLTRPRTEGSTTIGKEVLNWKPRGKGYLQGDLRNGDPIKSRREPIEYTTGGKLQKTPIDTERDERRCVMRQWALTAFEGGTKKKNNKTR